jgi:hypothetical protein
MNCEARVLMDAGFGPLILGPRPERGEPGLQQPRH